MFDAESYAAGCHVADVGLFRSRIDAFYELLLRENAKYNLTRITGRADFELKHVADSLALGRVFPEIADRSFTVADIGCGAGFPSVVLAAAFPELQITAIDSAGKKVGFVGLAARELGLGNLEAIQGRSVELNRKAEFQGRFDIVTARAVAASSKLWRECSKFIRRGGRFIFYKTPGQAEEELPVTSGAAPGLTWHLTEAFELPESAGTRLFMTGEMR